ncbi:GNAT family N-acetyltransferase [Aurantivibrio plasticivorans]
MLYLRKPVNDDEQPVQSLYEQSKELHLPWSYPPQDIKKCLNEEERYFLCLDDDQTIVGTFNISGIVRGYFQSAYLGYEVFSPFQGKGYMREGLALLIDEAFGPLNLHRLEANIQPGNTASIKLVEGAGFTKEGFSKAYLNIGCKGWQDHERWALVNEYWQEQQ